MVGLPLVRDAVFTFARIDVAETIARAPTKSTQSGTDQWGVRTTTAFSITDRHVFNV